MRKPPGFLSRLLGTTKYSAQRQKSRIAFNPLISKEISALLRQRSQQETASGPQSKHLVSLAAPAGPGTARMPSVGSVPRRLTRPAPAVSPASTLEWVPKTPAADAPPNVVAFPGCEAYLMQDPDDPLLTLEQVHMPRRTRLALVPRVVTVGTSWEIMSAEERSAYIFSQWNSGKCIRTPS